MKSSQFLGSETVQAPFEQRSFTVHGLLSLQGALLFTNPQPVAGIQTGDSQIFSDVGHVTELPIHSPL